MKTLYFFLPLLIIIVATPLSAQDIPEWHLAKMDKLGFIASFYQTPTASTLTEGESTCYSFENIINEKDHPNKLYQITVWESSNPTDSTYAEYKEEELTTLKLHSQGLRLIEKDIMQGRMIPFNCYVLQSKTGEYTHFYIGSGKNKVYTLEVICKKDEKYNADLIQFIRSFQITLYNNQIKSISTDSLSYTMNFPFTPKIQKTDSPEAGIKYHVVVSVEAPMKSETGYMGELEVISQVSVSPIEVYEISEICYNTDQLPEEISSEQKEYFWRELMHMIINATSQGKLLKKEEMKSGNPEGIAFTYTGINGINYRTFLCRAFYIKRKLYILQVLLRYRDEANHPDVINFLDSFRIK